MNICQNNQETQSIMKAIKCKTLGSSVMIANNINILYIDGNIYMHTRTNA